MPVGLIVECWQWPPWSISDFAQRVLDRMRLTDKQRAAVYWPDAHGSLIDIPILRNNVDLSINVGGAVVPLARPFSSWPGPTRGRGEGARLLLCRPGDRRLPLGISQ